MATSTAAEKAAKEAADKVAADTADADAAEKAAAENAAAEKAATDKAAAEKASAEKNDAKPATPSTSKAKSLVVTGPAVVLRADDGSERYLYRGAPVDPAAFSKDSIKHATSIGLIGKTK